MDLDVEPATPRFDWVGNWVGDPIKRIRHCCTKESRRDRTLKTVAWSTHRRPSYVTCGAGCQWNRVEITMVSACSADTTSTPPFGRPELCLNSRGPHVQNDDHVPCPKFREHGVFNTGELRPRWFIEVAFSCASRISAPCSSHEVLVQMRRSVCPIFSRFANKYPMECGLGAASQAIFSTISIPSHFSARHLSGLFVRSRTRPMPR